MLTLAKDWPGREHRVSWLLKREARRLWGRTAAKTGCGRPAANERCECDCGNSNSEHSRTISTGPTSTRSESCTSGFDRFPCRRRNGALAVVLVERFNDSVSREELARASWPNGLSSENVSPRASLRFAPELPEAQARRHPGDDRRPRRRPRARSLLGLRGGPGRRRGDRRHPRRVVDLPGAGAVLASGFSAGARLAARDAAAARAPEGRRATRETRCLSRDRASRHPRRTASPTPRLGIRPVPWTRTLVAIASHSDNEVLQSRVVGDHHHGCDAAPNAADASEFEADPRRRRRCIVNTRLGGEAPPRASGR